MLPSLVPEHQVRIFSFYFGGKMRKGACYSGELYCDLGEFDVSRRAKVYQLACQLADVGNHVVISSAPHRYMVWVSLRSPYHQQLKQASQEQKTFSNQREFAKDSRGEHRVSAFHSASLAAL